MAFSLLINKTLLGLFILTLTVYTVPAYRSKWETLEKDLICQVDIFINAFSNGRIQPNCKQFEKLPPYVCDKNYDPVCSTNGKTHRNECEFCNIARDTLGTVEFKHYGHCSHMP